MTPATRSTAARLARLHLRTHATSLARAELETLAGRDALDDEALIDLAEVRWRTGDLAGAGDAARAYLETGHECTVALVIAAEAAEALGRAAEAHRLVARALEQPDAPLDEVFGGLPRSTIWPGEAHRVVQGPLFGAGAAGGIATAGASGVADGSPDAALGGAAAEAPADVDDEGAIVAAAVSAWTGAPPESLWASADEGGAGGDAAGARAVAAAPDGGDAERVGALPSADALLAEGLAALVGGRAEEGVVRLALALRLRPDLAPLVLDALGDSPGPFIELLRGDALRVAGSEGRARRAWGAAMGSVTGERPAGHHIRPDDQTMTDGDEPVAADPEETQ